MNRVVQNFSKIFSISILTHLGIKYSKYFQYKIYLLCFYFNVKREITCQNVIKSQNAEWYKHTFFIVVDIFLHIHTTQVGKK